MSATMLRSFICMLSVQSFVTATLVKHDSSFVPDHVLRVSMQQYPQACYFRETAVVNGSSPGPAIRLKPNETSWVRVYNDMTDQNLTMHWHGLSQSVAPFSDGTPAASQWPIPPLHYFDYELHPDYDEPGTYFYHSHVGFQANSVNGPLIVEDHNETGPPYAYDDEKVFLMSEFNNRTDDEIITGLLSGPFIWPGEAVAFMVNGHSTAAVNQSIPPQTQQNCGYETFNVTTNMTYRFRFIGSTALSLMTLGFEDHNNLSIIAADASYTQRTPTDYLQVGSGQRFDLLINTKSEAELQALGKTNFWIQLEPRARDSNLVSYACLSYDGNSCGALPTTPPLTLPSDFWTFQEYSLAPLATNDFPSFSEVTRRVELTAQQIIFPDQSQRWNINNNTWYEDTTHPYPWLVNIYQNGQAALPDISTALSNDSFIGAQSDLFMAELGEVLEIVITNEPNGVAGGFDAHPFHLHGAHFYDIGSGQGAYNATANNALLAARNYKPVKRDTTLLYKYTAGDDDPPTLDTEPYTAQGWRAWRLRVTNPGVWMLHCHTLQHMVMGMQSIWAMGNASQITRNTTPGDLVGYLQYGGNVYGNNTWAPIVNHFFE